MLEVVNGVRRVLWALGSCSVLFRMLFCILKAVEGEIRLLEVLEVVLVLGAEKNIQYVL